MSRIARIRIWRADLSLAMGLKHASASEAHLKEVFLEIETSTGGVGMAEVRGNGSYATGVDIKTLLGETQGAMVQSLLDCPLDEASQQVESLRVSPLAKALADSAIHDACGREAVRPIWQILGGRGNSPVPVHAQIGFCTTDQAVLQANAAARAGFSRLKVRLGRSSPGADIAIIRAIREAVGEGLAIAVDANGGWDADTATAVLRGIERCVIAWAEQPTKVGDDEALRSVRGATSIPIVGDEAIRTSDDIERLSRYGAIDGVHLKLEKAGTVAALQKLAQQARRVGLHVFLGQMDQGRLGCSMTTHLAASIEADAYELWGFQNVTADVTVGLELCGGAMLVPDGPGNGMTVDKTRLKMIGEFR